MNRSIIILFLVAIIIGIAGCAKEGSTGPAGKDGNANVYTRTFEATPSDWIVSTNGLHTLGEIQLSLIDTNLTNGIMDSGTVEVFQELGYWKPLPITEVGTAPWGNHLTLTSFLFGLHTIAIERFRDDDSLPSVPNYNTTYKIVITKGHH